MRETNTMSQRLKNYKIESNNFQTSNQPKSYIRKFMIRALNYNTRLQVQD